MSDAVDTPQEVVAPAAPIDDTEPEEHLEAGVEGYDLHKNGTITAVIDGKRYQLRRPKIGEFRKLRESIEGLQDELTERAKELKIGLPADPELVDLPADDPRVMEWAQERVKANREFKQGAQLDRVQWLREVFEMLSTRQLPVNDDDLPTWFYFEEAITPLLVHWQSVPSPRGVA